MTTLLTMKWFNKKIDYLCFTANTAGSTVRLNYAWNPTIVNLEISTDWITRTDYTINNRLWTIITLSSIWDKVYFRNKSETVTWFSTSAWSDYYQFDMSGSISASWDINTLLCKNSTDTLSNYCFVNLFYGCASLTTAPELPATILAEGCYANMFNNCTALTTVPELPATMLAASCYTGMFTSCTALTSLPKLPAITLVNSCYREMFSMCNQIKLSTTQTWVYQTPYRIPIIWTWTTAGYALYSMFSSTWWTFTWTPTINTTYYTSNTVI